MKRVYLIFILLIPLLLFGEVFEVSIKEIQGEADVSPYEGDTVLFDGIVTGVVSRGYFVQDSSAQWCGIYVYTGSTPSVNIGDSVVIKGTVSEFYDLTEISPISTDIKNTDVELPDPIIINCADMGESYEGVLVELHNVVVTNSDLGYGEWEVSDSTGSLRVDDDAFAYTPNLGDTVYILKGVGTYTYSNYKIEPRDENDIITSPAVSYLNPYYVDVSDTVLVRFTSYSLGGEIKTVRIYKPNGWKFVVPEDTDLPDLYWPIASIGSAILDTVDSIPQYVDWITINSAEENYCTFFIVSDSVNGVYGFPVEISFENTTIYDTLYIEVDSSLFNGIIDIAEVQKPGDDGYSSAMKDEPVKVRGFVTGSSSAFSSTGTSAYIQDETGGVNVFSYNYVSLKEGQEVVIEGTVDEYAGLTEVKFDDATNVTIISDTNAIIQPETLFVSQELDESKEGSLWHLERGMIITQPVEGGPGYNMQVWNGRVPISIRINNTTGIPSSDIFDKLVPGAYINITGIVGQYDKAEPAVSGYQLLPRSTDDIEVLEVSDTVISEDYEIYPNPVNPSVGEIVRFNIYTPTDTRVYLTLYDKKGREISRILYNHNGGSFMIDWQVIDDSGKTVAPGLYMLDLKIVYPDGSSKHIKKSLVIAF